MQYRFLIYISYNYSIPIGEPLETELLKREYSVKWFCDLGSLKELEQNEYVLNSIEEVLDYQPHIILTITDKVPDFINALKVQVFHGFNAEKRSFKNEPSPIRVFFALYCTSSPSTTSNFNL